MAKSDANGNLLQDAWDAVILVKDPGVKGSSSNFFRARSWHPAGGRRRRHTVTVMNGHAVQVRVLKKA